MSCGSTKVNVRSATAINRILHERLNIQEEKVISANRIEDVDTWVTAAAEIFVYLHIFCFRVEGASHIFLVEKCPDNYTASLFVFDHE